MHDRNRQRPRSSFRQLASVEERSLSKERAQRGDPTVAGVGQHGFHGSLAVGHLPPVNGRTSSGMNAALAQDALERLSEGATGLVAGSKPKIFRLSTFVASRDSERGRWPTLHDAPHGLFQQAILISLRSVGAEQPNAFGTSRPASSLRRSS